MAGALLPVFVDCISRFYKVLGVLLQRCLDPYQFLNTIAELDMFNHGVAPY